jgi:diadenylate cyclase
MGELYDIWQTSSTTEIFFAALDFAIVFFVVYYTLVIIKGTRAVPILWGLVLVVTFYLLSRNTYWELPATHWFIEKFIANFIIIAVIIFQADIRRALAQFGRTFSSYGRIAEDTQILEEIVKGSVQLSQSGFGALIVIERTANLQHYADEGIQIDSLVSKDILFNLFLTSHTNPLHDGSVIIREGRIAAAGCFLPLANNPKLDKRVGTRHRAAIGLAEDTDAVIVVVSEESNHISIAHREALYEKLDANEMRDVLQKVFHGSTGKARPSLLTDRFTASPDEEGA